MRASVTLTLLLVKIKIQSARLKTERIMHSTSVAENLSKLLTNKTSRAIQDLVLAAWSSCVSLLYQLGPSRRDRMYHFYLWRLIPER